MGHLKEAAKVVNFFPHFYSFSTSSLFMEQFQKIFLTWLKFRVNMFALSSLFNLFILDGSR